MSAGQIRSSRPSLSSPHKSSFATFSSQPSNTSSPCVAPCAARVICSTHRRALQVFAQRYPRYLIRIVNRHEEFYALLMLFVERHYLRTHSTLRCTCVRVRHSYSGRRVVCGELLWNEEEKTSGIRNGAREGGCRWRAARGRVEVKGNLAIIDVLGTRTPGNTSPCFIATLCLVFFWL
jgi:hypothetical protein